MRFLLKLIPLVIFLSIHAKALTNSTANEEPSFQNNVLISAIVLGDNGDEVNGYCNATLLSNQVLITAAHCLAESLALSKNRLHLEVGAYKYVNRKIDGKLVRIGFVPYLKKDLSAHFILSKYLQNKILSQGVKVQIPPGEDVALILLNEKLELEPNFIFANIVPQKIWLVVKQNLSSALFQIVSINYWDTNTTDFKRSAVLNSFSYNGGGWIESRSTSRVEEGDSGSPVYIRFQNHDYLAAVVKGKASNIFSNWDVMASLSSKACNIARENALNAETLNLVCH